MSPHPRISVNSQCSMGQPLAADLAMWAALGIGQVGLISPKIEAQGWDSALTLLGDARLRVSNIASENAVIAESLHFAAGVEAQTVYFCTGRAASLSWDEATDDLCRSMAGLVSLANQLGVRLAVEPTNPLRVHRSFVFSLRDALDLAGAAGIGVVLDFNSCWYERGLDELVRKHVDAVALVQICDYVLGTFDTPNRAVPGDGDIPLTRLMSMVLEAGYDGPFDLEILGPRIETEGYASAIQRSVDRASAILEELGV